MELYLKQKTVLGDSSEWFFILTMSIVKDVLFLYLQNNLSRGVSQLEHDADIPLKNCFPRSFGGVLWETDNL